MKLLISACLLGCRCRYDGASKTHPLVDQLAAHHTLVPVCPEQLGGLATPRPPAERRGALVVTREGGDVTEQYRRGAEEALKLCRALGCQAAVLKERSPSCGSGEIYDGYFNRTRIPGDGITAEALKAYGIKIWGESDLEGLLEDG